MAAALIRTDLDTGAVIEMDEPDADIKRKAMAELIAELERRATTSPA